MTNDADNDEGGHNEAFGNVLRTRAAHDVFDATVARVTAERRSANEIVDKAGHREKEDGHRERKRNHRVERIAVERRQKLEDKKVAADHHARGAQNDWRERACHVQLKLKTHVHELGNVVCRADRRRSEAALQNHALFFASGDDRVVRQRRELKTTKVFKSSLAVYL